MSSSSYWSGPTDWKTQVSAGREKGEPVPRTGSESEGYITDTAEGVISLKQYFPTGTTVALEAGAQLDDSSLHDESFYASRLGMTVSQALLKGFGVETNLARLRQARLDTRMSAYVFHVSQLLHGYRQHHTSSGIPVLWIQ